MAEMPEKHEVLQKMRFQKVKVQAVHLRQRYKDPKKKQRNFEKQEAWKQNDMVLVGETENLYMLVFHEANKLEDIYSFPKMCLFYCTFTSTEIYYFYKSC